MLKVEHLTKAYMLGDRSVVSGIHDISFEVQAGEFYTLLGPSGCGKTTTLRAIAGLEEPSAGRIVIDDQEVFDSEARALVPANRRNIGMVFQSYAVWPHMTVFENIAFPLRMSRTRRRNEAEIKTKVERTLETVGLASLASRSAAQLSGGQQQRLSLARALVAEPRLLLLDEPLSNLDALLREQMRTELRRLQKEVGVTAIYVTHDQSEALALSDRLAIMQDDRIVQIGTPKNVYYTPANGFVATFIGRSNMLSGKVERAAAAHAQSRVLSDLGPLACTAVGDVTEGQQVGVMIRPEHVVLTADGEAAANRPPNEFQGTVANIVFLGEATDYTVRIGTTEIIARLTTANFSDGETVLVSLPPDRTLCVSEAAARPQID